MNHLEEVREKLKNKYKICKECKEQFHARYGNEQYCDTCKNEVNKKQVIQLKAEVIELTSPYEKYRKLCELEYRQREIKELVSPLMEEFRSISQEKSKYYTDPKELK